MSQALQAVCAFIKGSRGRSCKIRRRDPRASPKAEHEIREALVMEVVKGAGVGLCCILKFAEDIHGLQLACAALAGGRGAVVGADFGIDGLVLAVGHADPDGHDLIRPDSGCHVRGVRRVKHALRIGIGQGTLAGGDGLIRRVTLRDQIARVKAIPGGLEQHAICDLADACPVEGMAPLADHDRDGIVGGADTGDVHNGLVIVADVPFLMVNFRG